MAANPETPASRGYRFDGHSFAWEAFLGEAAVQFALVDIDTDHQSVDLVVKFAPGAKAPMHEHLAPFTALVLEGEHRIYEVEDGKEIVKVRPAGTFVRNDAGSLHTEGGGDEGATVWFNLRPTDGGLYALFDEKGALTESISVTDLLAGKAG